MFIILEIIYVFVFFFSPFKEQGFFFVIMEEYGKERKYKKKIFITVSLKILSSLTLVFTTQKRRDLLLFRTLHESLSSISSRISTRLCCEFLFPFKLFSNIKSRGGIRDPFSGRFAF